MAKKAIVIIIVVLPYLPYLLKIPLAIVFGARSTDNINRAIPIKLTVSPESLRLSARRYVIPPIIKTRKPMLADAALQNFNDLQASKMVDEIVSGLPEFCVLMFNATF